MNDRNQIPLLNQSSDDSDRAVYNSIPEKVVCEENNNSKPKYKHTEWITLATLALDFFSLGACISLQAPFFPAEAEKKGATPTEYGLIFGMYQLSAFLTAPVMGKLVAYTSPYSLLNFGSLTIGTAACLFGALDQVQDTTSFVALAFTIRIVEGIGSAALKTAAYVTIALQFPQSIGKTFALLQTITSVGTIIGPTVGGALYDLGGYGCPFFVLGGVVLLCTVIIFCVPRVVEQVQIPEKGNMLKFWLNPKTMMYSLSVFTAFNYLGFNQVTIEPHTRQFQLSGSVIGLLFGIVGTAQALTASLWGWLNDRKGNSEVLSLISCSFMVTSILMIGPAPFIPTEPTLVLIIAALIFLGLGFGGKTVSALTGTLKDTERRGFKSDNSTYGLVSAMITSSQSLGSFIGASVGGILLEHYGFRNATLSLLILETVLFVALFVSIVCSNKRENT